MLRLLLLATLTSAIACASVENVVVAEPGVTFSLPIGKTAVVAGSSTRLTFREVTEDSRCPIDAVCVWEGAAKIAISASRNGAPVETAALSLTSPNDEARLAGLIVRFVALAPSPATADQTPRKYVAELVIRKL